MQRNYGDSLLNPPISIAFGPAGLLPSRGRSRPATKSFEPRGRPARTESKASFAENAFREEFWVANLTSAHGRILRLIRAPFVNSFGRGKYRVANHATAVTPKPLNKFLAKITKSFYIRSRTAIPAEIVEPIVDFLNRGVSIAGIAPDGKMESPGNGTATA